MPTRLLPCRARLPGKGGFSPGGMLLLWLDFGPLDVHVGSSKFLVSCTLIWPWLVSMHESGENVYPCLFSLTPCVLEYQ